jgi:hypothetical protein
VLAGVSWDNDGEEGGEEFQTHAFLQRLGMAFSMRWAASIESFNAVSPDSSSL